MTLLNKFFFAGIFMSLSFSTFSSPPSSPFLSDEFRVVGVKLRGSEGSLIHPLELSLSNNVSRSSIVQIQKPIGETEVVSNFPWPIKVKLTGDKKIRYNHLGGELSIEIKKMYLSRFIGGLLRGSEAWADGSFGPNKPGSFFLVVTLLKTSEHTSICLNLEEVIK